MAAAIKARVGEKNPDGIADPGGKAWKGGLAMLEAKIKADQKILDTMCQRAFECTLLELLT